MTDLPKIFPVTDTLQRPLHDLRISVTDRCNLRCTYCMPREDFGRDHLFLPRAELLSFEEIERLAGSFVELGVEKIRLTGGEPLLRRNLAQLVEKLARLHTPAGKPVEVTLTTNAVLLSRQAQALRDAGLARLSVSLDGLSDEVFRRMSDSDVPVSTVLDGIAAAQRAGFTGIKVNMVVQRGVNDHEIVAMAEHFRADHSASGGIVLRFIEYMDVGNTNGWRMGRGGHRSGDTANRRRALPATPDRAQLHRGSGGTLGLCGRRRRDRRGRIDQPRVLPGLHPRPAVDRRQALHLFVCRQRTGPARATARGRKRPGPHRADRGALATTRRPLLGTALGPDRRQRLTRGKKSGNVLYRGVTAVERLKRQGAREARIDT